MTYQQLLEVTARPSQVVAEPSQPAEYDEIEIQSRWFAGHFATEYLSNHHQKITIISPGEWNRGAGPDFLRATITIDGIEKTGPIELDLDAQNWDLHGHSQSEHFNEVILHVVLNDSGKTYFTRTSDHREVPRILITSEEVSAALGRPRLSQALARPGRCLTPLARLTPEARDSLICEAANHRAELKATRFQQTANLHGYSQALWENLADALGFAANRLPMRLLAQRLSIKKLRELPPEDRTAVIYGAAGFLSPTLHEKAPSSSQQWLEDLWTRWWKHRLHFEFPTARIPQWSTRATRPGNHPHRRLAVLAIATTTWPSLVALSRQGPPFSKFKSALTELHDPFWDTHHTLLSDEMKSSMKLLGKSRLEEFLINTLFPLFPDRPESYQKLRAPSPNQKVKRASERLFGSLTEAKPHLKFAWQHQGLLQIYQDFCLEDVTDCAQCLFPEQLATWPNSDLS